MTFPNSIRSVAVKDTTKDVGVNARFYCNGRDLNDYQSELFGIETQLGATKKFDLTVSSNNFQVAGPSYFVVGGVIVLSAGGTVTFVGAGVNYVWVDDLGALTSGAALPVTGNYMPLALVTAGAGGTITGFEDLRPWLTGIGGGGSGSLPAIYRATTSEQRVARRDIAVLVDTDFLAAGLTPNSDSAYFDIEIVTDVTAVLTLNQIEGFTITPIVLGTVTDGVDFRKRVQAPKRYDGGSVDIEYQLQIDQAGTVEFVSIIEVEFDAQVTSEAGASGGTVLLPFKVAFVWNDTSPVALFSLLAGDVLTECEVVIETIFSDPTATLKVGVAGDTDAVLEEGHIDVDVVGDYGASGNRTSAIGETLILTIVPAATATGAGYVMGIVMR